MLPVLMSRLFRRAMCLLFSVTAFSKEELDKRSLSVESEEQFNSENILNKDQHLPS